MGEPYDLSLFPQPILQLVRTFLHVPGATCELSGRISNQLIDVFLDEVFAQNRSNNGPTFEATAVGDIKLESVFANGIEIAFLTKGEGPLVVCLHGFPSNAFAFNHQIIELSRHGYRVVAPFMRGHFPTAIPHDNDYTTLAFTKDVIGLIDALGYEKAVLFGHGLGAGTAYATAVTIPARVRRIIAVAAPYGRKVKKAFQVDVDQIRRAWHIYVMQSPIGESILAANDFRMIELLWRTWSPNWSFSSDELEAVKSTFRKPGAVHAMSCYYKALILSQEVQPPAAARTKDESTISQILIPTLYLHGSDDGVLSPVLSNSMEAFFPAGLRKKVIAGAGFFLQQEKPEVVNCEALEFLANARTNSSNK